LSAFWYRGGHWQEGRDWLARAVQQAPTAPAGLRAAAWLAIAELAGSQGDQEAAQPALDRCLVLARASGDMAMISEALWMAGTWATYRGDLARATAALAESLAAARAGGGPRAMARALQQLGNLAVSRGDPGGATALYRESLALGQGAGDYATAPVALYCLAGLALLREEYQVAQGYCEQGMALLEAVGNTHGLNHPQEMLGRALLGQGDTAGARAAFVACLASTRRLRAFSCLPHTLEAFARLALVVATPTVAARLLGAVAAVGQGPRPGLMPVEQALYERTLARAQADLGADQFAAAFAAGGILPPEEAMDCCRALA
jgi:tetratricopeptide (TPR) repeat protein